MVEINNEIINEKNKDRGDYIVLNNGLEDWRNSTLKDPGDWIEHEDEMTGASYWYSPSTKKTRNTEPPPPRKFIKKRKSSVLSTKETKISLLPGIKTKKDVVHHGFQYWGERIHLSEPLGAHIQMNVAPFVVSVFCFFFICFLDTVATRKIFIYTSTINLTYIYLIHATLLFFLFFLKDQHLIDYQFGQMQENDPLIGNPLVHNKKIFFKCTLAWEEENEIKN